MSNISTIRDSILNYELKKRPTDPDQQINAADVKGRGHLDSDGNNNISSKELQNAADRAGVDISTLTGTEKLELTKELSSFVRQGGSFEVSTTDPNVFSFKITPTTDRVLSAKKDSEGNVSTFSKGQSGPEIRKVNTLLSNLGFPARGDKFNEDTEKFVKSFQLRNFFTKDNLTGQMVPKKGYENIQLGVIDAKTLDIMEEATKLEKPYQRATVRPRPVEVIENHPPIAPPQTNSGTNTNGSVTPLVTGDPATNQGNTVTENTNSTPASETGAVAAPRTFSPGAVGQFERVRDQVKNQIIDGLKAKGMSPEEAEIKADQAFQLGGKLTDTAVKQDRLMGSDNMCYTAVKRDLEQAVGIPYKRYTNNKRGDFARTASDTLFKQNADLFQKIQVPRSDVQFLPPGAIVVYSPPNKSAPGHIGVQTIQLKTPAQARSATTQGLAVTNVYEQDGKIVGLDVKVGKATVKYTVENGKVFDQNGKATDLSFDHADISDKQRNDPWSSAPVDVFYPISAKGK